MSLWGWTTDAEATAYFTDRLASDLYTGSSAANQKASMMTAYNRLIDCKNYSLTTLTPTSADLRRAQCEMAFYLLKHLAAEDHRTGLQVQNVVQAGIVQEVYEGKDLPIPPIVDNILEKAGYKNFLSPIHIAPIGRDESLDLDEHVDEWSEEEDV